MRYTLVVAAILCPIMAVQADDNGKPPIKVLADGFPAGHDTPEAAACDLARAFIRRDAKLFEATCIKAFGQGKSREEYAAFLQETAASIKQEAGRKEPSPEGPKSIAKVFAARNISRKGPASYARTVCGFQDVKFVDVGAVLHSGKKHLNRTLVIQDKAGKWYAHPLPESSPLLRAGLNEEPDSRADFSEVYRVQK
jgi:hypothetical protein